MLVSYKSQHDVVVVGVVVFVVVHHVGNIVGVLAMLVMNVGLHILRDLVGSVSVYRDKTWYLKGPLSLPPC